jgi:hypothetical protein
MIVPSTKGTRRLVTRSVFRTLFDPTRDGGDRGGGSHALSFIVRYCAERDFPAEIANNNACGIRLCAILIDYDDGTVKSKTRRGIAIGQLSVSMNYPSMAMKHL